MLRGSFYWLCKRLIDIVIQGGKILRKNKIKGVNTMTKANKELALEIMNAIGGAENIKSSKSCTTRLRMNIKDTNKIDEETLTNIEGVMAVNDADTYQVILVPGTAEKLNKVLVEDYNVTRTEDLPKEPEEPESEGIIKKGTDAIKSLFD